ncbi:MAG: DinB family protein [Dehalococcoidia bacterium]
MSALAHLADEFDREAASTRRLLARLPDRHFAWRPHPKSFTAGELAAHTVDCLAWVAPVLTRSEYNVDPATFRPFTAATSMALVAGLDATADAGRRAIAAAAPADLEAPWRFLVRGRVKWERPRAVVLRDFTFSHLAHHRGQFSVYLRLLDLPVPGVYGPSADDR